MTPEMVGEYLAGASIREIADRHDVSPAVVRHGLDRAGIDRARTELARQYERDLSIIRLRDAGLTWAQISKGTGIPTSTLQRRYVRALRSADEPSKGREH